MNPDATKYGVGEAAIFVNTQDAAVAMVQSREYLARKFWEVVEVIGGAYPPPRPEDIPGDTELSEWYNRAKRDGLHGWIRACEPVADAIN